MSIWDTVTGVFTGQPMKDAAEAQRQHLAAVGARGRSDIERGYTDATGAVRAGTSMARGDIGAGYTDASGALSGARDAYAPLSALGQKYGAGTDLYLDALGVRGPEGNTRATAAFQAGPGYQFTLDQGLDSINRRRNAMGMAASGNADYDAINYATGLANQTYNDWRNSLGGLVSPELSATSGAATGTAGIGRDMANLATQRGQMLGDLAMREGTTLGNLATGAAGQRVNLDANLASPYAKTYGDEANAEMMGSKNLWDFGLNLAKLGSGIIPGLGGGSGYGNNIGDWNPNVPGGRR